MTTQAQPFPATRSESRATAALIRAIQDAGLDITGERRDVFRRMFIRSLREDGMTIHYHHKDQAAIDRYYRAGAICAYFAEHTAGAAFVVWRERRDTYFRVAGRLQLELDEVGK